MNGKVLPVVTLLSLVFFSLTIFASAVSAATRYVDDTGSVDVGSCTTIGSPCLTIQYAINHASTDDTVSVAAGTYTEQININKPLTLSGAGSDTTNIVSPDPSTMIIYDTFGSKSPTPRYNGHRGTNIPVVRIAASNVNFKGFHVNLHDYTFLDVKGSYAPPLYSRGVAVLVDHVETVLGTPDTFTNIIIENNKIDGLKFGDKGDAIKVLANSTASIQNNLIYGYGESAVECMAVDSPIRAAFYPTCTVNNNIIYGGIGSGARGDSDFFGIGFWSGATGSADGNTIYNTPDLYADGTACGAALNSWTPRSVSFTNNLVTSDGGGVGKGWGAQLLESPNLVFSNNIIENQEFAGGIKYNPNINISGSTIRNCVDGFLVDHQTSGSVVINYNSFIGIGSGHFAVKVGGTGSSETTWGNWDGESTVTVDATKNWWGDPSGPTHPSNPIGIGDGVSNNVDYSPWLGKVPGSSPMTWYTNDKIQDAIDVANAFDKINVLAGTYTEDLVIGSSKTGLELSGAGALTTTIKGISNVPVASFPLAAPNIEILASGVKLHRFTIESPSYQAGKYSSGMVIGAANVEIYSNTFKVTPAANADEISQAIQTYHKNAKPGVSISGLNIHDNTFTHIVSSVAGYEGIWINLDTETGTATIKDNEFTGDVFRAITTERSKTTISGNTIITDLAPNVAGSGGWQGINIGGANPLSAADSGVVSTISVTDNTIGGSSAGKGFTYCIKLGYSNGVTSTMFNFVSITNNGISMCGTGVWVRFSANGIAVNNNRIFGNTMGVTNDDSAHMLNAENNWWGSNSGPGPVGLGTGDKVSAYVDYDPWLSLVLTLTSPDNKNYDTNRLPLTMATNILADTLEYSLDGHNFVKLCKNCDHYDQTKTFSDGAHTIIAKATLGTETDTETRNFLVDTDAPKIKTILPKNGAILKGDPDFYIKYTEANIVKLSLFWKEASALIYNEVDMTGLCPSGENRECSKHIDLSAYDGHDIKFFFQITDPIAMHTANSNQNTITIDDTSPVVTISSPLNGTISPSTKFLLSVSTNEKVDKLEYSTDGSKFKGLCNDCKNYAKSTNLPDGNHVITIKATDYAGNEGYGSVHFFVDSKKPKIIKQTPADNGYTNGAFDVFYTEEFHTKSVTLYYKGVLESTYQPSTRTDCDTGKNKECPFNVDLTSYNTKHVSYYFVISDDVSQTSSKVYTVTVDTDAPIITEDSWVPTSLTSHRVKIDIKVNEDVLLEYSDNGGPLTRLCTRCDSVDKTMSFAHGLHEIFVKATDAAGNIDTDDTVTFIVSA